MQFLRGWSNEDHNDPSPQDPSEQYIIRHKSLRPHLIAKLSSGSHSKEPEYYLEFGIDFNLSANHVDSQTSMQLVYETHEREHLERKCITPKQCEHPASPLPLGVSRSSFKVLALSNKSP